MPLRNTRRIFATAVDVLKGTCATRGSSINPQAIYVHPGEPIFESILTLFLGEFEDQGNRGAVYVDSQADEPYLFYLARAPVLRHGNHEPHVLDEALAGIKRFSDGRCEPTPAHLLLTLASQVENDSPIASDWIDLADNLQSVETYVIERLGYPMLSGICDELQSQLEGKKRQIQISMNLRKIRTSGTAWQTQRRHRQSGSCGADKTERL